MVPRAIRQNVEKPHAQRNWLLREALRVCLDGPVGLRLLRAGRIAASPAQFLVRRFTASAALRARAPAVRLDPRTGHALCDVDGLERLVSVLSLCNGILEGVRSRIDHAIASSAGRLKVGIDILHDDLIARERELVDFALQDKLLLPVVEYLGTVPYLGRLALTYARCVAGRTGDHHFQSFHCDDDDFRHVKMYVHVADVGPENGPLCFLPADVSERVLAALAREGKPRKRGTTWKDEEVFRHCDRSQLVSVVGPPGTCAFVDLSRCLHYGSRVAPGCERFVLVATWLRYHRLRPDATNRIDPPDVESSPLRRLALESPIRHVRGAYCFDRLGPG